MYKIPWYDNLLNLKITYGNVVYGNAVMEKVEFLCQWHSRKLCLKQNDICWKQTIMVYQSL